MCLTVFEFSKNSFLKRLGEFILMCLWCSSYLYHPVEDPLTFNHVVYEIWWTTQDVYFMVPAWCVFWLNTVNCKRVQALADFGRFSEMVTQPCLLGTEGWRCSCSWLCFRMSLAAPCCRWPGCHLLDADSSFCWLELRERW